MISLDCISDLEDSIEKGLSNQSSALSDIDSQWRSAGYDKLEFSSIITAALTNAANGEETDGSHIRSRIFAQT